MSRHPLLVVDGLTAHLTTRRGIVRAVDGVSFTLEEGEALGLVGESGSGKSMTCLSIVGLLPRPAGEIVAGRVLLDGDDLLTKSDRELRRIRGRDVAMILQDPLTSLNPVFTIGDQVIEAIRLDEPSPGRREARRRAVEVLRHVGIPSAEQRLRSYPFEFSGGMRQRVTAAIAISRRPRLLIADEPTTALDVTTQRQFLELLKRLRQEERMALILVTHDLGLVAEVCDRVAIMYAGRIVESGAVDRIFDHPAHPYTQALLGSIPEIDSPRLQRLTQISGEPPDMLDLAAGCRFAPRCPRAFEPCGDRYPRAFSAPGGGTVSCWLHQAQRTASAPARESA